MPFAKSRGNSSKAGRMIVSELLPLPGGHMW
jgi:hypothetical protein